MTPAGASRPTLASTRLTLRPAAEDDAPALRDLFDAPEVRRFLFDDSRVDDTAVAAALRGWREDAQRGLGAWTLRERDASRRGDQPLVGCAWLSPVREAARYAPSLAGEVEPGFTVHPSRWGRGYAGEALAALVAHAFGTLRLPRLVAVTDAPNQASARVLLRAGFRETGKVHGAAHLWRLFALEASAWTS